MITHALHDPHLELAVAIDSEANTGNALRSARRNWPHLLTPALVLLMASAAAWMLDATIMSVWVLLLASMTTATIPVWGAAVSPPPTRRAPSGGGRTT